MEVSSLKVPSSESGTDDHSQLQNPTKSRLSFSEKRALRRKSRQSRLLANTTALIKSNNDSSKINEIPDITNEIKEEKSDNDKIPLLNNKNIVTEKNEINEEKLDNSNINMPLIRDLNNKTQANIISEPITYNSDLNTIENDIKDENDNNSNSFIVIQDKSQFKVYSSDIVSDSNFTSQDTNNENITDITPLNSNQEKIQTFMQSFALFIIYNIN